MDLLVRRRRSDSNLRKFPPFKNKPHFLVCFFTLYCFKPAFLNSCSINILAYGEAVLCIVGCLAASLALPTTCQYPSFALIHEEKSLQTLSNIPWSKIVPLSGHREPPIWILRIGEMILCSPSRC